VVRWQTGISASVLPLIEYDMKRVDPDSLTQFVLTTDGGIVTPCATHWPVLVLVGEKETPVARSTARRLQREIPGAQAPRSAASAMSGTNRIRTSSPRWSVAG
jgi:hypothetical protein